MGFTTGSSGSGNDISLRRPPVPEFPDEEMVAFTDHLWRKLAPGERVLDVGCGRGRNTFYLARAGFEVDGVDVSRLALSIACARSRDWGFPASYQAANLLRLPFADESFAAAVCVHVLPYHRKGDLCRGMQELRRVLRPGGYLYFDLFGKEDIAFGGGQPIEPGTFFNPHGLPLHFSDRMEIDEISEGFHLERILHMELHSVLGERSIWGVWAVKSAQ